MLSNAFVRSSRNVVQATQLTRSFTSTPVSSEKTFGKILIANRGEITCRVIKTARRMGIKTVSIFSDPDADSMHVKMADEAVHVGPAASAQSYLNMDAIMHAIEETGAEAVHPGYGFLSENVLFYNRLKESGITFIGPGPKALASMGDKIESKEIGIQAGVNTIPGFQDLINNEEHCCEVSNMIGYPVMIKASAGGGGKGMRIAWNDTEAREGFRMSKDEAMSSFGDDRIFIEKFIEDPRHIEIQLIADRHGNVVALPERECSIQRRNQKVIEEAPSMLLTPETRKAMGDQACMLARAVDYESAGTVEFLADNKQNFYFLEMNTRLQVEHPVTELVTGVDLVEQMIRVAAGHPLPDSITSVDWSQPENHKGWSLESRVYAEDPLRGFLPSTGRLITYKEPRDMNGDEIEGVRIDTGISEGSDISMFYDPMICKLITHGNTRDEAIATMNEALDSYVIRGPGHNLSFLRDLYRHPKFQAGTITTKFIEEEYPEGFLGVKLTSSETNRLYTIATVIHQEANALRATVENQFGDDHTSSASATKCVVSVKGPGIDNRPHVVAFTHSPSDYDQEASRTTEDAVVMLAGDCEETSAGEDIDGVARAPGGGGVSISRDFDPTPGCGLLRVEVDGEVEAVQILEFLPEGYRLQYCGGVFDVIVRSEKEHMYSKIMLPKEEVDTSKFLLCPMPGLLVSVAVEEGQTVQAGQELCIVEAMKMQNVLRAEKTGVVKTVLGAAGATLKVDEIIIEFEEQE